MTHLFPMPHFSGFVLKLASVLTPSPSVCDWCGLTLRYFLRHLLFIIVFFSQVFAFKLRKLPCLAINRFFSSEFCEFKILQIYFCFTLLPCSPFDYLSFLSLVVLYFSLRLSFLPVPLSESALWLVVLPSLCVLVSDTVPFPVPCCPTTSQSLLHRPKFATVVKGRGGPSSLYTHIFFLFLFFYFIFF